VKKDALVINKEKVYMSKNYILIIYIKKRKALPIRKIIGDLSDREKILLGLELKAEE